MEALTICIDVGGTFVDLAIYDGSGTLAGTHKVLNRPGRPEEAVLQGVDQALATINRGYADVTDAIYSTTLAINAIIERRGARAGRRLMAGARTARHSVEPLVGRTP
jgi:N-methylhydantoinase A